MKTNYHTHSKWCDGADTAEAMALAAIEKGFDELGFSSHAAFPVDDGCAMTPEKGPGYAAEIRALAEKYAGKIRIFCGVEADYIRGQTAPDRARYAALKPDYLIGSIHYVVAPDGALVPVDHAPEILKTGLAEHFGGGTTSARQQAAERFIHAYFEQEREMVSTCDFDIVGHPDLVRKFNSICRRGLQTASEKDEFSSATRSGDRVCGDSYFDESADWYRAELEATADAIAASGKLVEVNTGAISRGWLDDVYPSAPFRDLLRARGVKFILSSDAHFADALDCAFDRFGACEAFVRPAFAKKGVHA